MAITDGTSNQTKFFSSGAISARAFKDNFNSGAANTNIKFSTYKRNTDKNETNPIVPDATENASISSSNSDITASDFRDTIKEYIVTQSGSNENVDIDAQDWNSNFSKNVRKQFKVDGTISATASTSDAARLSAEAYNLTIDVTGNIYGEGGDGGVANGSNGANGGDALYINNTSARSGNSAKITVQINSNGRIWAGGGGGASGDEGNPGSNLSCYSDSTSAKTVYNGGSTNPGRGCNSCPNTDGNKKLVSNGNCGNNSGNRSRCRGRQERGQTCTNSYYRNCVYRTSFNVAGGAAGNGGNGGHGKGYSTLNNSTGGNSGNSGNTNNCASKKTSSTGNDGNPGASGGGWGQPGSSTTNHDGGDAGRAIFRNANNGNTFFVNGQSTNNVKGGVFGKV